MIDLEPVKEVMQRNIVYIILLGAAIIAGKLLFKKLEKWLRTRRRG